MSTQPTDVDYEHTTLTEEPDLFSEKPTGMCGSPKVCARCPSHFLCSIKAGDEMKRIKAQREAHAAVMATVCPCGHPYSDHNKERSDGGPPFCNYTLARRCGCNGLGLPL